MKRKLSFVLAAVILLGLIAGTAFALPDTGGGSAHPGAAQPGYPQYPDEYYDAYGGSSNDSTVTLEVVGDMGLRVLVTETDGVTPIEGAGVKIVTVSSGTLLAAVTNGNGIAFIELPRPGVDPNSPDGALKPEDYTFSVEKEGYLPQEDISVSFDGHTVERHIMLERAAQEFTFYVTDVDDHPVEGASIRLTHYSSGSQTGEGITDAEGKLVLTLPVTEHKYVITHPDYLMATGNVTCGTAGGVHTVKLKGITYKATVRVVDKDTKAAIGGVVVRTADGIFLLTNADGSIPFPSGTLAVGTHQITLTKDGYIPLRNYKFTVEKRDGQEILIEMQSTAKNITPGLVENITPETPNTPDSGPPNLQEASATRSVNRSVDVEACVVEPDGSYVQGAALTFLPENLSLTTDENGRAVFHGAAIGKHTINAEKDGAHASLDFELMIGNEMDVISGESNRVVITEDMETVTLFLELKDDALRLAGFTKDSMQDDQLNNGGGAVPYTENAVLDQDGGPVSETGTKMTLPEAGLLWMLLVLLAILVCCAVAAYVYKKEQEKRYESLQN